eukprot:TRINITY_DN64170_c0_g1_i1.p1 TRINITY_DN64170_c0_g1~~TRINITY_DN64170_c0_g1_i1.p1  ORF type:complete len:408 (+),score=73.68 TRINITY_DN64170_c0_g1_i1:65-1288(+)
MDTLYLISCFDRNVFIFSATGDGTWYFSRVSDFHRKQNKDKFVFCHKPGVTETEWVLQDQSSSFSAASVIGEPDIHQSRKQDPALPPLGVWRVWDSPFTLTGNAPTAKPLDLPFSIDLPFVTMNFTETGTIGHLEVTMRNAAITDDGLEKSLEFMRQVLTNLARRPEMIMLIKSHAGESQVPAYRHIRRFLDFIADDVGTECVLVGRASAIILVPSGIIGRALLGIINFVQRILPAPWPQTIVSTLEEADAWLEEFVAEARLQEEEARKKKEMQVSDDGTPESCKSVASLPAVSASSIVNVDPAQVIETSVIQDGSSLLSTKSAKVTKTNVIQDRSSSLPAKASEAMSPSLLDESPSVPQWPGETTVGIKRDQADELETTVVESERSSSWLPWCSDPCLIKPCDLKS